MPDDTTLSSTLTHPTLPSTDTLYVPQSTGGCKRKLPLNTSDRSPDQTEGDHTEDDQTEDLNRKEADSRAEEPWRSDCSTMVDSEEETGSEIQHVTTPNYTDSHSVSCYHSYEQSISRLINLGFGLRLYYGVRSQVCGNIRTKQSPTNNLGIQPTLWHQRSSSLS